MKTSLSLAFLFACLSLFAQTSSRPLRFYESIAAMVANRPITNEVLAVTQRSGTNAGPLLFFWHAPTSAPTNTVDTFNAIGGGQLRLITNVVTVAISDGSITTNKWDSVAHQWVSGKQDYSAILAGLTSISYSFGDLLWWNGSALAAIHIGTNGQALTVGTNQYYFSTPSAGAGSSNASTNANQGWAAAFTNTANGLWIFNGAVNLNGTTTVADLNINAVSYSGVWPLINGGTGATTASDARTALGLAKDVDVQTFRLPLLQIYLALAADGDMPYRNASGIITNLTSTSAGRALLTAINAAAQRSTMGVPNIAGDTFTGPLLVPYIPYNSNQTNVGSNYVVTARAVAEKIEALSIGGFISSVTTNFRVSGGQLEITNVKSGSTGQFVRMSDLDAFSPTATNSVTIEVLTNSTGTWTKSAGAKWIEVYAFGAGGGGGSGAKGTNATGLAGGGGGGAGAGMSFWHFSADEVGSSFGYTNGIGGGGGASQTSDGTAGIAGTNGGATYWGSLIYAPGGAGGNQGLNTGSPTAASATTHEFAGSNGGTGAVTSGAAASANISGRFGGAIGGGGGGGVRPASGTTLTNVGAATGTLYHANGTNFTAASDSITHPNGYDGADGVSSKTFIPRPGMGGSGGTSGHSAVGSGGQGGWPGGGGGGGTGTVSANNSGAGGKGGDGVIVVITHF